MVAISSRVPGWAVDIRVISGDVARRGDLLVSIDDRDTRLLLKELDARLASVARRRDELLARIRMIDLQTAGKIRAQDAAVDAAQAGFAAARTREGLAQVEAGRFEKLAPIGAVGRDQLDQARAALEEVAAHFRTFNLDLMYALPGQTLDELASDLDTALSFQPPHLSVYHLTLEPNTFFAKHPPELPDDDTAWDMLDLITQRTGDVGMERYEVSAYARPGHRCWHNTNYWQFGDYLGIGAGAHGKLSFAHRILRQVRWREPRLYMDHALQGQPCASETEVSPADLPFEFMLNALRLREGFALSLFSERTGLPVTVLTQALLEAVQQGWLVDEGGSVRPTERGFDFLSDLQALFLP